MPACALAALVAAGALAAPPPASAGPAQATLQRFAASNPGTSALVWRLDEEGPVAVAAIRPDVPRIPASNMKMVTAAGALLQLGPDFRFTTRLATAARAPVVDGTLRGPLFVMGAGDPMLATRAYGARYLRGVATPLADLVRPLPAAGIRRVAGPIVADEGLFDAMREGPRWLSHYHLYSQPLSALAVNQGYAGNGRRAEAPVPWRAAAVRVRGALHGVRIAHEGGMRRGRPPASVRVLSTATSAPLRAIVREMNVPSDNFVAEMLTKAVGAHGSGRGTSAGGTARTEALLAARGVLTGRERLVDGSGLSRDNRLTATALVRLVAAADADPDWGRALLASLPRGGEGTLATRLRSPRVARRVQAKTGYINGASSLSGRVVSVGGQRYAFAMLMNTGGLADARRTQEQVVTLLALGREDPQG